MGTISELHPDIGELEVFFDTIWKDSEGYVYLPTKDPSLPKEDAFEQHFFPWPSARSEVVNFVRDKAKTHDVYFAPAIFQEPSATKKDFKESNVVWCEFDGTVPESFQHHPSLVVQSSTEFNRHVYWVLTNPVTDPTYLEKINRGLTYHYGADASGWDSTQILRPPTTQNYKRETPVRVKFLSKTDHVYTEHSFQTYDSPQVIEEIPLGSIPDVTDVLFKYAWPAEAAKLVRGTVAPVGERSTMLMRLGYYCAEMGMTNEEIYSVIRNADDRWGKFKGRKDRDRRLMDLVEKVRVKYPMEESTGEEHLILGWNTLIETDISVEWLIPDLLQRQGYMLLTGPAGVGKTQFTLNVGKALALGEDFLDLGIREQTKVLLISCEMGLLDLKYFMENMSQNLTPEQRLLLEENFKIEPRGEPFYLDNPSGQKELDTIIEFLQPDVLMFDSIGSATGDELTTEKTVKRLMDYNDRLRNKYGIATWFIHHNRKATSDNKEPNKLSDVYGNQYLVNRATSVVCLWPTDSNNDIKMIELKKRLAMLNDPWIVRRSSDLSFSRTMPAIFEEKIKQHLVYKPQEPQGLSDTL